MYAWSKNEENLKSMVVEIQKVDLVAVSVFNWKGGCLPSDELSVQNGLLIMRAQRFPLCIIP